MLSGIVHALRCGGRWVDCVDVYGPKKTLYNRFVRWSERGIWEGIFSALAGAGDALDRLFIDSSCIKVHRCADGGKGGLGSWYRPHEVGRNTKLHAVCDIKGRPCVLLLTPGNVHDRKGAKLCIEAMPPSAQLVADKGYDSQALREWLVERGTQPVIPPRKNRKVQHDYDRAIYRQRNVVERMFCRLRTGAVSPPASTAISKTSSEPSASPPPSSGGCSES